ncbi:MAG: hypothetical protein JW729_06700 [Bacteroidales bacterium]|nr:hypothetical protein [Bacteroidales bacterium]
MKKITFFLLLALFALPSFSQNVSDVFTKKTMTFYGLDFSNTKLIGSSTFVDPQTIKSKFYREWNDLMKIERKKYDVAKFYQKRIANYAFDIVTDRNKLPTVENMVIDEDHSIGKDLLDRIISKYRDDDHDGLGLTYVVESINAYDNEMRIWVTFFDIKSRKILLTELFVGKAGGAGIRNFWAKAYYNVMRESEAAFKKWELLYSE